MEEQQRECGTCYTEGLVSAIALGACTITCSATDGSGVFAECTVIVEKNTTHEHVDLGLPSGTLWATCNVGASKPVYYYHENSDCRWYGMNIRPVRKQ